MSKSIPQCNALQSCTWELLGNLNDSKQYHWTLYCIVGILLTYPVVNQSAMRLCLAELLPLNNKCVFACVSLFNYDIIHRCLRPMPDRLLYPATESKWVLKEQIFHQPTKWLSLLLACQPSSPLIKKSSDNTEVLFCFVHTRSSDRPI